MLLDGAAYIMQGYSTRMELLESARRPSFSMVQKRLVHDEHSEVLQVWNSPIATPIKAPSVLVYSACSTGSRQHPAAVADRTPFGAP